MKLKESLCCSKSDGGSRVNVDPGEGQKNAPKLNIQFQELKVSKEQEQGASEI